MAIQSNFPAIRPSLLLDFANSKRLDPRITFTRASTARYYDGSTVAKAEENLLQQSQAISTSPWGLTDLTAVTGKTAPDGTSTAVELTATAANGVTIQSVTMINGDYTFSVWLRRVTGTGDVEISTASAGGWVAQTISGTWARYTVTATRTAGVRTPGIRVVTSGDVIEAWGAQLEQRSAVTAYTATTTAPITNYVPQLLTAQNGVPRFDHNPTTGESLGLLIEEQRTNLFLYSGDLSDAAFVKSSVTVSSNTIVAPDGTLTGDKVIVDSGTASASGIIRQQITKAASAITYTASFFAKAGEFNSVRVIFRDVSSSANFVQTYFNLATGTVASAANSGGTFSAPSSSISAVGNGWYRCVLTGTTGTETTVDLRVLEYNNGTNSITGDGYSGLYLWGYQLEAGAFPTSYIATTAASATRQADAASMTGTNFSSWFRDDEGTMYFEGQRNATTNVQSAGAWGLVRSATSTGTTNCYTTFEMAHSNTSRPRVLAFDGAGTATGDLYSTAAYTTAIKTAVALKNSDAALAVNGTLTTSSTYRLVQQAVRLFIGSNGVAADRELNGTIRKLAFYASRLTNAQLQAITG